MSSAEDGEHDEAVLARDSRLSAGPIILTNCSELGHEGAAGATGGCFDAKPCGNTLLPTRICFIEREEKKITEQTDNQFVHFIPRLLTVLSVPQSVDICTRNRKVSVRMYKDKLDKIRNVFTTLTFAFGSLYP